MSQLYTLYPCWVQKPVLSMRTQWKFVSGQMNLSQYFHGFCMVLPVSYGVAQGATELGRVLRVNFCFNPSPRERIPKLTPDTQM